MKVTNTQPNYGLPANAATQKGVALIMVMTVLFALTVLGLAATDSSNLQSVMVRNNQFRLESFNASFSEIEDQLEFYTSSLGKTVLFSAIDVGDGNSLTASSVPGYPTQTDEPEQEDEQEDSDSSTSNNFEVRITNPVFTKTLTLQQDGGCPVTLNSLGGFKKCSLMRLDSGAVYQDTNIGSNQSQQFTFKSF